MPDIIDLNEVMDRVEGDKDLLIELIEIFLSDYPIRMDNLRKAEQENNIDEIKNVAHSLKGASANISAKPISQIFLEIETKAKEGQSIDMMSCDQRLESLMNELKAYLENLKNQS